MDNQKGPYWEDVERNRIFTIALIYGKTADKLALWDAAEAEACYQKKIDLLTPLAPVSFGLAETLRKLSEMQKAQGKTSDSENTLKRYEEMCRQLEKIKKETLAEHPELLDTTFIRKKVLGNLHLNEEQEKHDYELLNRYRNALNADLYRNDFYPGICEFFQRRGISLCVGNPTGGILLTGINPSYPYKIADASERLDIDFGYTFMTAQHSFWNRERKMLGALSRETAYLDLFPLKFCHQDGFEEVMEQNREMRAAIVSITQMEIETNIKPVLIIVANQQSSYYWGRNSNATWMGYEGLEDKDVFPKETLPESLRKKDITLCQIRGFKDRTDRLNKDKLASTNLAGSLVLFYGMYTEKHIKNPKMKDKILNAEQFKSLYEFAIQKKQDWKQNH